MFNNKLASEIIKNKRLKSKNFIKLSIICFLYFFIAFYSTSSYGQVLNQNKSDLNPKIDNITILEQRLVEEEQFYALSKNILKKAEDEYNILLEQIKNNKIDELKSKNNILDQYKLQSQRINLQLQQLNLENSTIEQSILAGKNSVYQLDKKLQSLASLTTISPALERDINNLTESIKYHKEVLLINKKRLDILSKYQDSVYNHSEILKKILYSLSQIVEVDIKSHKISWLTEQEVKLNYEINKWLNIEIQANKDLSNSNLAPQAQDDLKIKIVEAENNRNLLSLELSLLKLNTRLSDISGIFKSDISSTIVSIENMDPQKYLNDIEVLKKETQSIEKLATEKLSIVKNYIEILNQEKSLKITNEDYYKNQLKILNNFKQNYKDKLLEVNNIIIKLNSFTNKLNQIYLKNISIRQKLPSNIDDWSNILQEIISIPYLLSKKIIASSEQFKLYFNNNFSIKLFNLFAVESIFLFLIFLFFKFIKFLRIKYNNMEEIADRLFSASSYAIGKFLNKNKLIIVILANIYLFLWFSGVSTTLITIFLWLSFVYLLIKLIISSAYIFFIENTQQISGNDARLYKGLKRALLFGGVLSVLLILSQELILSFNTQFFIARLFMLFLLAISYPLIINWEVMPKLIINYINPKPYVQKTIWLLGLIIPITILSNAAVGLVGYINLAWTIAIAELQISLVIVLWLIFKGIFSEILDITSRFFIRNIPNGWLWTESVLKPIGTVINIILFIFTILGLIYVYSINRGVELWSIINSILSYEIIISENKFCLSDFLRFCVFFAILLWATKWSREFSYRWIYSKTKDLGTRNSLSILTQYSVLLVGIFVILYILEFPMHILTVAFGGLIVALGFGLRDIFSNYISGIILLIERPVRVGDYVTVGEFEGKITKIGMRSLTIEDSNNMDVIVPNRDTILKSLINWTFKDTVVRSELLIRIDYSEDLERIRQLILDVIYKNEEILDDPIAKIYFHELSESAVIAKLYYYLDLNKTPSRASVETKVIIAIDKLFKQNNIMIAYPHQTVNLNKHNIKNQNIKED